MQELFDRDHFFVRQNILRLHPTGDEPRLKAPLRLSGESLAHLTAGHARRPDFGLSFPARFVETPLAWDDLVLHPGTLQQVREIESWLQHGEVLMNDWGMASKLRPGYRALFYVRPARARP